MKFIDSVLIFVGFCFLITSFIKIVVFQIPSVNALLIGLTGWLMHTLVFCSSNKEEVNK